MMKQCKSKLLMIYRNINNLKSYEKTQWIILLSVILFSFLSMSYEDLIFLSERPYSMVKGIFTGEFGISSYLFSSNYGFTLWLVIMIWNIPLLIVNLLMGDSFSMEMTGALLWNKLGYFLISLLMIEAILRIARHFGIKKEREVGLVLITMSSVLYLVPVIQLSQCDIVGITFALWGIYYFIKKDNKKFILLFAVANPMKYFSLFLFIPLVLLRWKKIKTIVFYFFSGSSLIIINIILRRILTGQWREGYNSNITQQFIMANNGADNNTSSSIQIINDYSGYFGNIVSGISIFIFSLLVICIIAFAINESKETDKWSIYLPFLAYAFFILFYDNPAYRLIILIPFLVLLIYIDKKWYNLSLVLELFMGITILLIKLKDAAWVLGGNMTFERLLFKGRTKGSNLSDLLYGRYGLDQYMSIFKTVFTAALIGFIILHLPILQRNTDAEEEKTEQILIWSRVLFALVWTGLNIYALLF